MISPLSVNSGGEGRAKQENALTELGHDVVVVEYLTSLCVTVRRRRGEICATDFQRSVYEKIVFYMQSTKVISQYEIIRSRNEEIEPIMENIMIYDKWNHCLFYNGINMQLQANYFILKPSAYSSCYVCY